MIGAADPSSWSAELLDRAARIRLLGLDVDGTLTDGKIWIGPEGEVFKGFHVQDGLGIKLVQEAGIEVVLITARESRIVIARARELAIDTLVQGRHDKLAAMTEVCSERGLALEAVAFMGDDLADRALLGRVGLAAAPANAHSCVLEHVHWQSKRGGGDGAVREFCDLLLAASKARDRVLMRFL